MSDTHSSTADAPVNLDRAFASFDEQWAPRVAAEANGQAIKLAKVEGEFVWHRHDVDELFLVVSGALEIQRHEAPSVELSAGELFVVPAGVEHRPVASEECEVLLFEPSGTSNTGDVESELTSDPERLEDTD